MRALCMAMALSTLSLLPSSDSLPHAFTMHESSDQHAFQDTILSLGASCPVCVLIKSLYISCLRTFRSSRPSSTSMATLAFGSSCTGTLMVGSEPTSEDPT